MIISISLVKLIVCRVSVLAINRISLSKLLKLMFAQAPVRRRILLADIRSVQASEAGQRGGGGDFYSPFWADAKRHVSTGADLTTLVEGRITANNGRRNLYPELLEGFQGWWNGRRRWANRGVVGTGIVHGNYTFDVLAATVKVDNALVARDDQNESHVIYPYFATEPELSDDAARLGLWLCTVAISEVDPSSLSILDVFRGRTFSLDRTPLRGTEAAQFEVRYQALLNEREQILNEIA